MPVFKSFLHHLATSSVTLELLPSLWLGFIICKMELMIMYLLTRCYEN